jgi:hypothetical protein
LGLESGDLQIHQLVGLDQRGQGQLAQELGGERERKRERKNERERGEIIIGHLRSAFLHNKVFVGVSLHWLLSNSMICSSNHSDCIVYDSSILTNGPD